MPSEQDENEKQMRIRDMQKVRDFSVIFIGMSVSQVPWARYDTSTRHRIQSGNARAVYALSWGE